MIIFLKLGGYIRYVNYTIIKFGGILKIFKSENEDDFNKKINFTKKYWCKNWTYLGEKLYFL